MPKLVSLRHHLVAIAVAIHVITVRDECEAHAAHRCARQPGRPAAGGGQVEASAEPGVDGHAHGMTAIVVKRARQPVGRAVGPTEAVGHPSSEWRGRAATVVRGVNLHAVRPAGRRVSGPSSDLGSGWHTRPQGRRHLIAGESGEPFVIGLEPSDHEIAEALVVGIDPSAEPAAEGLLQSGDRMQRPLRSQRRGLRRAQVDEVVRLKHLLIAWDLGVNSQCRIQPHGVAEAHDPADSRRNRRLPRHTVAIHSQARLHHQPR